MKILCISILVLSTFGCTSYQGIRNADPQVTLEEIVEVGNSQDVAMANHLGKLLQNRTKDPSAFNAEKTVETIIALQKLNPDVAQNELVELTQDKDEEVRYYAAETLGAIRNSKSVLALASFIESATEDDILAIEAASRSLSSLTLVPIHQDGIDTKKQWTEWWQTNQIYFKQDKLLKNKSQE